VRTWISIALAFVVIGGSFGYLILEKLSGDAHIEQLTKRLATLETAQLERVQLPQRAVPPAQRRMTGVSIEGAPVRGPEQAPITIVEFSDFQCPFCSRVHPTLQKLLAAYPDSVRLVFKHNPLPIHPDAPLAHRASIAAGQQGRFWEMHDKIFANARDLSRRRLVEHARDLGLDIAQFTRDLDSSEFIALLERDIAEADRLGITGMPTFYINGRVVSGAQPYENFKALIEREATRSGVSLL
jgi:protein-disulfide isomerase